MRRDVSEELRKRQILALKGLALEDAHNKGFDLGPAVGVRFQERGDVMAYDLTQREAPCMNPESKNITDSFVVYQGQQHRGEAACELCQNYVSCALSGLKSSFRFMGLGSPEPAVYLPR